MCAVSHSVPYARDVLHKLSQTGNSMVVLHYTCVVFPVPSYGEILRFGRWLGRSCFCFGLSFLGGGLVDRLCACGALVKTCLVSTMRAMCLLFLSLSSDGSADSAVHPVPHVSVVG